MAKLEFVTEYNQNNNSRYNVYARDLKRLKELRKQINFELSYQVFGNYTLDKPLDVHLAIKDIEWHSENGIRLTTLSSPTLSDGTAVYRGIKNIDIVKNPKGYDEIVFEGKKVFEPELTKRLNAFINIENNSVEGLILYQKCEELESLEGHLHQLDYEINFGGERLTSEDIYRLHNESERIKAILESGQYFDSERLKAYYNQICDLIELHQIKNTKEINKLTLTSFIRELTL